MASTLRDRRRAARDAWGREVYPNGVVITGAPGVGYSITQTEAAVAAGVTVGLLSLMLGAPLWAGVLLGSSGALVTNWGVGKLAGA